jgi:hypothetical protein
MRLRHRSRGFRDFGDCCGREYRIPALFVPVLETGQRSFIDEFVCHKGRSMTPLAGGYHHRHRVCQPSGLGTAKREALNPNMAFRPGRPTHTASAGVRKASAGRTLSMIAFLLWGGDCHTVTTMTVGGGVAGRFTFCWLRNRCSKQPCAECLRGGKCRHWKPTHGQFGSKRTA